MIFFLKGLRDLGQTLEGRMLMSCVWACGQVNSVASLNTVSESSCLCDCTWGFSNQASVDLFLPCCGQIVRPDLAFPFHLL